MFTKLVEYKSNKISNFNFYTCNSYLKYEENRRAINCLKMSNKDF